MSHHRNCHCQKQKHSNEPRKADYEDFHSAQNMAIQSYRYLNEVIANNYKDGQLDTNAIREELTAAFFPIFSEDSYLTLSLPGTPLLSSKELFGLGPENIVNFAILIAQNRGELQVFGGMMKKQIYPGNNYYDEFPEPDPKSLLNGASSPIKLLLDTVNTDIVAPITPDGSLTTFTEYRERITWILDVSNCPCDGKKVIIRRIDMVVLSQTSQNVLPDQASNWQPIKPHHTYHNSC